jgi:integrase
MERGTRGNGTTKSKGNRYLAKFPIGRAPNKKSGRYETVYETKTFSTKTEAQRWLNKKIAARENGQVTIGGKQTFKQYSEQVLLNGVLRISPRTADGYYRNLRKHFYPIFGKRGLTDIEPSELDNFFSEMRKTKSASTVNALRTAISAIYKSALRQRCVTYNPVTHTLKAKKGPFDKTQVCHPWSLEEVQHVLLVSQDTPLECFFKLAISTGMRRGEILGLRWCHVDFEHETVSIEETIHRESESSADGTSRSKVVVAPPKTESSRRVNRLVPAVVNSLHRHRLAQEVQFALKGKTWSENCYVFTDINGNSLDERNFYRTFVKFLAAHGIRRIRIHDIRHTFATILVENDVGLVPAVSRAVGHSSLSTTMDIYAKTAKVEDQVFSKISELVFPFEAQRPKKKVPKAKEFQQFQTWQGRAS